MEKPTQYPLPRFSVNRPVTVVMSLIALLVVGYIAYTRIPLTLFPEGFDYPRLFAWGSLSQRRSGRSRAKGSASPRGGRRPSQSGQANPLQRLQQRR